MYIIYLNTRTKLPQINCFFPSRSIVVNILKRENVHRIESKTNNCFYNVTYSAASVATDNQNYFMMNSDRPDQMFKIGSQFHLMCANLKPEKVKNIRWLYRDEVSKDVVLSTNFRVSRLGLFNLFGI